MASSRRAAFAAITSDEVDNPFQVGQLFGVDVDYVAGLGPLIPADWHLVLQVPQVPKPDGLEPTLEGGAVTSLAMHRSVQGSRRSALGCSFCCE